MLICDIPMAKANCSFAFAAYRVTLRFMTRQRRRTQICIIASSSVALLLVTLSLIHPTGTIFPLQVHLWHMVAIILCQSLIDGKI